VNWFVLLLVRKKSSTELVLFFGTAVLRDLVGSSAPDKASAYLAAAETKVLDLSRSELGTLLRLPAALSRFRATGIRMLNLSYNGVTDLAPLSGDLLPNLEGICQMLPGNPPPLPLVQGHRQLYLECALFDL
jgi:hypothetical protein